MRVRVVSLSCLALACSLSWGEVKIVVQENPTYPKLVVIVQDTPSDPGTHPKRTFEIDDPQQSPDPFSVGAPDPLGPVGISPPHYAVLDPSTPMLWSPFIPLEPVPPIFLNPLGDLNGDGPPDIGMSAQGAANPPTIVWSRQVERGNHDPVFARFIDGAWTEWTVIASNAAEDMDPLWLEAPDATIHSVWRRIDATSGNSEIRYASRGPGETVFVPDVLVSAPGASSSVPTMALRSTGEILIAYDTRGTNGAHQIVVASLTSAGDSFQTSVMGMTSFSNPDPAIQSRSGHTWLVWTESATQIAYAELVDGIWSTPIHVVHDAAVTDGKARMKVQTELLRR